MKARGKWFPILLSATVFPGAGQWYVGRRLRGGLMIGLTLLLTLAGVARFLSVVFALANKQGVRRPPELNPFPLLAQAWKIDYQVLLAFLLAIASLWILSILDLTFAPKEGKPS
ncbi:hypothetical protein FBR05_05045 [Deltaproteobacteria bacterium PRO3]|nr:hypothetical protein [Deltaproteobacteria bacterium PRO3]